MSYNTSTGQRVCDIANAALREVGVLHLTARIGPDGCVYFRGRPTPDTMPGDRGYERMLTYTRRAAAIAVMAVEGPDAGIRCATCTDEWIRDGRSPDVPTAKCTPARDVLRGVTCH